MAEDKDNRNKLGQLIRKAWSDEQFKKRLLSDTLTVLNENGISVPEGVTVRAVENTEQLFHLVIPAKPSRELSDAELAQVAAGGIDITLTVINQSDDINSHNVLVYQTRP